MRILHVLDHSLPLHSGYTFRTRAIMKAQIARGWKVAGLTGVRQSDGKTPAAKEAGEQTVEGLRFFRTAPPAGARSPLREFREIRALRERLVEVAGAFRPRLIHVHSPVLNALAAQPVATRLQIPLLYEIRAFWEDAAVGNGTGTEGSARYRATRALETRAAKKADAVAVICEGLRGDLVSRGIDPAKIIVSPNGVDLEMFGSPPAPDVALAERLGLIGADVAGYVGSFYDYEGLDDLIAAMPAAVAARPGLHLLLVGGGPREAALRAQAAASPVANRIIFTGRVGHDEVERYYSLIDILVYPRKAMRLTELVTPLKPLEAMAQERLVIASAVGGHRELIDNGVTGTLFPPDDPSAIADALTAMFGDRGGWDRRRQAARAFVERERNWSSNILRYLPVYQQLTGTAA